LALSTINVFGFHSKISCWSLVSTLSTITKCQHSCFEWIQSRPQELHFAICWSPWMYKMGTITSETFISCEDHVDLVKTLRHLGEIDDNTFLPFCSKVCITRNSFLCPKSNISKVWMLIVNLKLDDSKPNGFY